MFINAQQQFSDRQNIDGIVYSTRTIEIGRAPSHHHAAPPPLNLLLTVHSAEDDVHAIVEESNNGTVWTSLQPFTQLTEPGAKAGGRPITPTCEHLRIKWVATAPAVVSAALVDHVPSTL